MHHVPASAAGGLDRSFGSGGIVRAPGFAFAVAPGASGRVLATGVARGGRLVVSVLRADGKPDPRFGRAGRVTPLVATGQAVAPAAKGRIVAAGTARFQSAPGSGFFTVRQVVVRLTPTGSLDRTFGGGDGAVVLGQIALRGGRSTDSAVAGISVAPSGKITVAGTVWRVLPEDGDRDPLPYQAFLFTRLNADGTPDRTFGRAGRLLVRFPGAQFARLGAAATDRHGRFLAAGWAGPQAPQQSRQEGHLAIARLDATGRLDPAFGTGGLVLDELALPYPGTVPAGDLAIQPDGKPVISTLTPGQPTPTSTGDRPIIQRLTADGRHDPTFGTDGQIPSPVVPPGPIVARGTPACPALLALGGTLHDAAAASFTANGSPDRRFGHNGLLFMPSVASLPRPGRLSYLLAISGAASIGNRVVFSFTPGFDLGRITLPPPACPPAP
ncbi:MAG: hypothetical protein U0R70_07020 [Solirubrobacteraceae bacterium]